MVVVGNIAVIKPEPENTEKTHMDTGRTEALDRE